MLLPCSPDCTSGALQPPWCSQSPSSSAALLPAASCCSGELRAPPQPSLLSLQCPKLLLAVTSRRRGSSCQLCAYVHRDTLQLLCCTHTARGSTTKTCPGTPWVRQGHNHSQGKFSHASDSHLFKDLGAHSRCCDAAVLPVLNRQQIQHQDARVVPRNAQRSSVCHTRAGNVHRCN